MKSKWNYLLDASPENSLIFRGTLDEKTYAPGTLAGIRQAVSYYRVQRAFRQTWRDTDQ